MHDLDRTQLEADWETEPSGSGQEFEPEFEGYEPESDEFGLESSSDTLGEFGMEATLEGPFSQAEEEELTAELLEVTDEAELDQFLGKLIRRASRTVGKAVRSPVGRSLIGSLRGIAKRYLPMAGAALGNMIAPGVGGAIGSRLASAAGQAFGLELEGLSSEDQEFELARSYVRLAGEAAKRASVAPPTAPAQVVAQKALTSAARKYAPGLVGSRGPGRRTGQWRRQGRMIILYGV